MTTSTQFLLLLPIVLPALAGASCLILGKRFAKENALAFLAIMAANLGLVTALFLYRKDLGVAEVSLGPAAWSFALTFQVDSLSAFITLAAAVLGLLLAIYTAQFMEGKPSASTFFAFFLFTIAGINGAVLADHLITLLFFWEGMMISLFMMIALGGKKSYRTAAKAFFINGVTDLCLMGGIGLVLFQAKTLTISEVHLTTNGLGGLAFVLLMIGATSKAGSMPFHSWIPDAADDAPLPFMALMPGAMEKLVGIYFLARVSLQMFTIGEGWAGTLLMTVGSVTILLAVLMALVQKDFKRLLSFHAISQVGYMILGIGTGTALGIVGGLFHMVNNAMYKSTLFLTGGAVEQQAGTTDLKKISGLAAKMPITWLCFAVAAFSISGFPFTNGFYSKEMVYDGALERGWIFYAAAAIGSFFTAASFLKLGHAAFKGVFKAPKAEVKEAPLALLVPMVIIAAACLLFGLGNIIPINGLIVPAVSGVPEVQKFLAEGNHFWSIIPHPYWVVGVTCVTLALAWLNHRYGVKKTGTGLGAVDHIHYAPVAHQLYDAAERRWFDPYVIALRILDVVAYVGYSIDRGIDFLTDKAAATLTYSASTGVRQAHTGSHAIYLAWSVAGGMAVLFYLLYGGF